MVSYYWVESEQGSGNNKSFTISNMQDRRTVEERELARAIRENKVILLNYHLSSSGSGRITKLRTNQIIPEEKIFQGSTINKLMGNYMIGKYIIREHLDLIRSLFHRDRDAASNKFLHRLIDVVRLYFSYLDDVNVKVIIRSEKKAIKLCKQAEIICNRYALNKMSQLSNNTGLAIEFNKFKDKYINDFQSYDFILILLNKLVDMHNINYEDIDEIVIILNNIIKSSRYTFIGEQMDKQFCNDLLDKYKKSVYDNITLDLHRLTNAERKAKAEECCKLIVKSYNDYENKLKNNRNNIIQSIRNGGNDAVDLMDTLNKLNSFDYTALDSVMGRDRNRSTPRLSEEYDEYLLTKVEETKIIISKIEECMKNRGIRKAIKALDTAIDLCSSAMLKTGTPEGVATKYAIKCTQSLVETNKLADDLVELSINSNLPGDIAKLIRRIHSENIFVPHMVIYMYEKLLYHNIKEKEYKKKFGSNNIYVVNLQIEKEFNKKRSELLNKTDSYLAMSYEGSYLKALSDLMTVDSVNMICNMFESVDKLELLSNDRVKTERRHLEKAWIPAYKILTCDINQDIIYNNSIQDSIFWKIMEDTYVALKMNRADELRNRNLDKYMSAFNDVYKTNFVRSKDIGISILKIAKDTR